MRISNKISLFLLFLLSILAINTMIGLVQLSKINRELRMIVKRDIVLSESMTQVTQQQLEKGVLFERLLRIAEELGFEDVSPARRTHLLDHTQVIRDGFNSLTQKSAKNIIDAKAIIDEGLRTSRFKQKIKDLQYVKKVLLEIEQRHIYYDKLLNDILDSVTAESFILSFEDIQRIKQGSSTLSQELKTFIAEIQNFSKNSLTIAKQEEDFARRTLWLSFGISLFISVIIAWALIKSIAVPLRDLSKAAQQVGEGNFFVRLKQFSKDEIGDVSRAFNVMTQRLMEFTGQLKHKKEELALSLQITQQQNKDLEKVNKELDDFVHTVSHDIRAPLVGIIGYAEYLKKHINDTLEQKEQRSLDGILKSAKRLQILIHDLLELTRISRVKNPYEKVDITQIIFSIQERLEYDLELYQVDFQVSEKLPEIVCDRIKISEVFLNLINNAIKFSSKRKDTDRPRIRIDYESHKDAHEFIVSDNGVGIPEAHEEYIFGLFRRAHHQEKYEGTGAGLSIVKAVVESHGGRVWVQSKEGEGAAFHFTIPNDLTYDNTIGKLV